MFRTQCEMKGEAKCGGSQGEIHKLICKNQTLADGGMMCCCAVNCEKADKTALRLDKEMSDEMKDKGTGTGMCMQVSEAATNSARVAK